MKAIFSDEVARELGYQKYWPELHDWVLATCGVLAALVFLAGIFVGVLMLTGNWDKQFQVRPCSSYANYSINDIPIRCISDYGITTITK